MKRYLLKFLQPKKIFISYRRKDASGHAGRLYADLRKEFGKDKIFIDVAAVEGGDDFEEVIEDTIGASRVFLAIIGQRWLIPNPGAVHPGKRDWVHFEIETALKRGDEIRVIPILVEGANLPEREELPETLVDFPKKQWVKIDDEEWESDVERLIQVIKAAGVRPLLSRRPGWWLAILGALLVAGIAFWMLDPSSINSTTNTNDNTGSNSHASNSSSNTNANVTNGNQGSTHPIETNRSPMTKSSPVNSTETESVASTSTSVQSVEGSIWNYERLGDNRKNVVARNVIEFKKDSIFHKFTADENFTYNSEGTFTRGEWKQTGDKIDLIFTPKDEGEETHNGIIIDNKSMSGEGAVTKTRYKNLGRPFSWRAQKRE